MSSRSAGFDQAPQGQVFRRSPRALWRTAGPDVLLTTPDRSDFDRLSGTGAVVWALLDRPLARSALLEVLSEIYAVSASDIATDVSALMEGLQSRGLVEVGAEDDD